MFTVLYASKMKGRDGNPGRGEPDNVICLLVVEVDIACEVWSPKTMILGIGYSLKVNEVVIGLHITITMIIISHRN